MPNRQDQWGRDVTNEGSLGPDFLSPIRMSTARHDPVNDAVIAADAHIGMPGKKLGQRKLTPEEYRAYSGVSGQSAHTDLQALVAAPGWRSLPLEDREDVIRSTVTGARKDVRGQMFGMLGGTVGPPPPPLGYLPVH